MIVFFLLSASMIIRVFKSFIVFTSATYTSVDGSFCVGIITSSFQRTTAGLTVDVNVTTPLEYFSLEIIISPASSVSKSRIAANGIVLKSELYFSLQSITKFVRATFLLKSDTVSCTQGVDVGLSVPIL